MHTSFAQIFIIKNLLTENYKIGVNISVWYVILQTGCIYPEKEHALMLDYLFFCTVMTAQCCCN